MNHFETTAGYAGISLESYQVAIRAVKHNKNERYMTFAKFFRDWNETSSSMIFKVSSYSNL